MFCLIILMFHFLHPIVGVIVYFAWGYRHSKENLQAQASVDEEQALLSDSDTEPVLH